MFKKVHLKHENVVLKIICVLLIVIILLLLTFLGYYNTTYYFNNVHQENHYRSQAIAFHLNKDHVEKKHEIYELCMKHQRYITCLNEYVTKHFQYRINDGVVSFDVLFDIGADCEGWSFFYREMLKLDGWETKNVFIGSHVFVVAQKDNLICKLDQTHLSCVSLAS